MTQARSLGAFDKIRTASTKSCHVCCAGTVLNYFADSGLNKATILFPGVACFAMAVIAGATTHIFNEQYLGRRKCTLEASHHGHAVGNTVVGFEHGSGELVPS